MATVCVHRWSVFGADEMLGVAGFRFDVNFSLICFRGKRNEVRTRLNEHGTGENVVLMEENDDG